MDEYCPKFKLLLDIARKPAPYQGPRDRVERTFENLFGRDSRQNLRNEFFTEFNFEINHEAM